MNQIKLKLLDSGIPSLINGYVDFFNINIHSFLIGDAVNFIPSSNETAPHGNITYTGNKSHIKYKLFDDDKSLKISLVIPEEYDEIVIGNIVLYSWYGGSLKAFAMLVLSEPVTKRNPTSNITDEHYKYPGNRLSVNLSINYVDINDAQLDYEFVVMTPNYANLPYFPEDTALPLPEENPHAQFIVNEMHALAKRPAFVTKTSDNLNYFATPLFQNIDGPKFGILNSFESDYYAEDRITWIWGQTYTTPNTGFKSIVGGIPYTDDDSDAVTLGGLAY